MPEGAEKRRHQRGQQLARARAPRRRETPCVPGADGGRDLRHLHEAEAAQRLERLGIVLRAGEDEAAAFFREWRRRFEEARVVSLHGAKLRQQRLREFLPAVEIHEAGDVIEALIRRGQSMRLLVGDHLQPVFERPEEAIGLLQFVRRLGRDPLLARQLVEHRAGLAAAQLPVPATGDQLLRLDEEFDLADAAAAELHVMAVDGDDAMAAHRMDLALHRMDVVDRREIEILAPDIGRQHLEEALTRLRIARDRARLDEGRALPVLPAAFVIVLGRRQGHGDRRAARIGPEAKIGAEDIAMLRPLLQDLDERLRQPDEERALVEPRLERELAGLVEDDDVDVARIVEFARAVFAHAEDGESAAGRRDLLGGTENLSASRRILEQPLDAGLHGGIREIGERGRDLFERPGGCDVRHGDEKRRLRLRHAQVSHEIGLTCGGARGAGASEESREGLFGNLLDEARQPARIGPYYARKEGRISENAFDEPPRIWIGEESAQTGGKARILHRLRRRLKILHVGQRPLGIVGTWRAGRQFAQRRCSRLGHSTWSS